MQVLPVQLHLSNMKRRIYIPKTLAFVALVWLVATLYAFEHGGIVAGVYLFAVGASPALVAVWLAAHPSKED